MRNRLEENAKVLVENQKKLRHWQEKLSKLTLQNLRYDRPLTPGQSPHPLAY